MPGARTEQFIRKESGSLHVVANEGITTGNIFFVSSGAGTDATGYGKNPDRPLATLDYAIGQCTASAFDRIYLMPGHAETISAAGGVTADVAGVTIIGLGQGSNRPTLSFANTASTVSVTAANVTFRNIRVTSTVDEVVKMFHIQAANCTIDGVDHFETASCQTIQFLLTTASGTDLVIKNCRHYQANNANSAQRWIELVGASRTAILDNVFILKLNNSATSITISSTSSAPVDIEIGRNVIVQTGGTSQTQIISLLASTTGHVHDNRCAGLITTLAGTLALASCYGAENYVGHTVNKNGILDPGVDS